MKRAVLSTLFLLLSPAGARCQDLGRFEYAVKFVCGKAPGSVVAPGVYYTAINVHNPNEKPLVFRKKVAIALPSEKAGRVSSFFEAKLGPDQALEIDCPDILWHADSKSFLKGFIVIESDLELDVVAVYTTAGATERVGTFFTERVPVRRR
jgi:hypothetical protein